MIDPVNILFSHGLLKIGCCVSTAWANVRGLKTGDIIMDSPNLKDFTDLMSLGGQYSPFPIDFALGLTRVQRYRAAYDEPISYSVREKR